MHYSQKSDHQDIYYFYSYFLTMSSILDELWELILDLIGPEYLWDNCEEYTLMRRPHVGYKDRMKLIFFAFVNGCDPEIMLKWLHLRGMLASNAYSHCESLINLLTTRGGIQRFRNSFSLNVWRQRYEYLDGRVRCHRAKVSEIAIMYESIFMAFIK